MSKTTEERIQKIEQQKIEVGSYNFTTGETLQGGYSSVRFSITLEQYFENRICVFASYFRQF